MPLPFPALIKTPNRLKVSAAFWTSASNRITTVSLLRADQRSFFSVSEDTLDLSDLKLDEGIVEAVTNGIAWLKDGRTTERVENRRQVPRELLEDRIAMNLLMSSISTIIAGSMECHQKVIKEKQRLFTHKNDYINAMYECLQRNLDDLTVVAINRGVQYYVDHS